MCIGSTPQANQSFVCENLAQPLPCPIPPSKASMSGVDALKGTCMSEGWCNCAVPQARARVAASVASANYGTALEDVKNYIVAKENCGKQAPPCFNKRRPRRLDETAFFGNNKFKYKWSFFPRKRAVAAPASQVLARCCPRICRRRRAVALHSFRHARRNRRLNAAPGPQATNTEC